jgi:peroxiredoxin
MKALGLVAVAALLASVPFGGDGVERTSNTTSPRGEAIQSTPLPIDPPNAFVEVGDPAPNVSYLSEDNRWRRLSELLHQGHALLVFGASPAQLRSLERERDALARLGVIPVAVLDVRSGAARGSARRLGLSYLVISDSRRILASQFNAVDRSSQWTLPAWFVIDRSGRVRGLGRGRLPESNWTGAAATALGLPAPGATVPSGAR